MHKTYHESDIYWVAKILLRVVLSKIRWAKTEDNQITAVFKGLNASIIYLL